MIDGANAVESNEGRAIVEGGNDGGSELLSQPIEVREIHHTEKSEDSFNYQNKQTNAKKQRKASTSNKQQQQA